MITLNVNTVLEIAGATLAVCALIATARVVGFNAPLAQTLHGDRVEFGSDAARTRGHGVDQFANRKARESH